MKLTLTTFMTPYFKNIYVVAGSKMGMGYDLIVPP